MSASIIEHKDGVLIRPGDQLDDREMKVFDHKAKVHHKPGWFSLDRSFSRIEKPMRQKASGSREGRDHTIPERTPISDQGRINSCVANSWCDALEILDGLGGRDKYWTARYYTGDTDDEGCYLRAAAHQLRKIGVVEEKYLPYKDTTGAVFESPALDLYTMAGNNRLEGFYRVTSANSTRGGSRGSSLPSGPITRWSSAPPSVEVSPRSAAWTSSLHPAGAKPPAGMP